MPLRLCAWPYVAAPKTEAPVVGNLDLVGTKQVFKGENNPWVPPIADQFQIGVSHVFDYIRSDTYK